MVNALIPAPMDLAGIVSDVLTELDKAQRRFPAFNSPHEGYAVILEEMDELWEEVKDNKRMPAEYRAALYGEVKQVAAMAFRFMLDVIENAE